MIVIEAVIRQENLSDDEFRKRINLQRLIIVMVFSNRQRPVPPLRLKAFFTESNYFAEPWEALLQEVKEVFRRCDRRSWDSTWRFYGSGENAKSSH